MYSMVNTALTLNLWSMVTKEARKLVNCPLENYYCKMYNYMCAWNDIYVQP